MRTMNWRRTLGGLLIAGLVIGGLSRDRTPATAKARPQPRMEIVFVVDTTGSMSSLIEGAKRKVWSIVNEVLNGKPRPEVRIGLIAYRDRSDAYVTRITPLTDDLDALYGDLMGFAAKGGGDTPESVNQALNEAVTKIKWTPGEEVLKIVFLVGDAPPHMDYPNDVKHPETTALAVRRNILINTVQCGNLAGTREVWQAIARSAEGRYAAIPADGGSVAVSTPFDGALAEANKKLVGSAQFYGDKAAQSKAEKKLKYSADAVAAPAGAAGTALRREVRANQASVRGKAGRLSKDDFLDALRDGRVKLEEVPEKELPDELQKAPAKQRPALVRKLSARRQKLLKRIRKLSRKREAFLARQRRKQPQSRDSFDEQVLAQIRAQAKRVGVKY